MKDHIQGDPYTKKHQHAPENEGVNPSLYIDSNPREKFLWLHVFLAFFLFHQVID